MKKGNIVNEIFDRTVEDLFSLDEFTKLLQSGKKIRVKYGVDVTAPYLHIGHAVNLWMMRYLQDMGHKIIFLIGDFTTRIGDPTGKDKTRPIISLDEISANTEKFIEQAKMVLKFDDPSVLEIRKNSEWYESMPTSKFLELLSYVTHTRLISRDMFQERIKKGVDIYTHELVYPILQAYDSYVLQSDLTIIGSDQLFNEMLGRHYQEKFGQEPQIIITSRITPGIDGKSKQSKSLDNYIGLGHSPRDKFGRTMRIPDNLISDYLEVYTSLGQKELGQINSLIGKDPFESKKRLAYEIVCRYHGEEVASVEKDWFDNTFSQKTVPNDIPVVQVTEGSVIAFDLVSLCIGNTKSKGEIRRLLDQRGVSLNNEKIDNSKSILEIKNGDIVKIGKRTWFRLE